MADRDADDDTGVQPHSRSTNGTPRWVKVFGGIALVLVLLFVILLLSGRGGGHGPSRHASPGDRGAHVLPSSVTEHGVRQPRP
ncbi:MAG: hypothetical protein LC808_28740 [Actinobacteria bacterium]|nr:hypothetical protein [Actinomycetota bacterium]